VGTKLVAGLLAVLALAWTAAASASPPDEVDRERLKKTLANLPSMYVKWGIGIGPTGPTEWSEESETPPDPAALRAKLKGDDSDADVHLDLAAAHRRLGDAAHEKESLATAIAMLRREAAAHSGDGHVLASLAAALAASGADAEADLVLNRATSLAQPGWEPWTVSGNVLATRGIGAVADRRFADVGCAYEWVRSGVVWSKAPPPPSPTSTSLLAAASVAYGKAIEAAVKDGSATDIASAYLDRWAFRTHRLLLPREDAAKADAAAEWSAAVDDMAKSAEATPEDPRAITLVVALGFIPSFDDKRPAPTKIDDLPEPARGRAKEGLARLAKLAESKDAAVASRALQGLGAIGFLLQEDPAGVERTLRGAVAKDPSLRQSWTLLMGMFVRAERWDDLAKLLGDWLKTGDTAEKRMFLARAEERRGDGAAAEKQWRQALALDPKGYETNLGLANALLRNAKAGDDLKDVEDLLGTAAEMYSEGSPPSPERWCELTLSKAVLLGLTGDLDGAAATARRLLDYDAQDVLGREVLAAIGR
jgi:tetratricopeptide (TPR) repeat protein